MPYSPESIRRAEELIQAHGGRAIQLLVDQIVASVKVDDDLAAADFDRVLRAVDRLLSQESGTAGFKADRKADPEHGAR